MKKYILSLLVLASAFSSHAQLNNFVNKVKNKVAQKVSQRADQKIDKTIDKGLDEIEGKGSSKGPSGSSKNSDPSEVASSENEIISYSKFDFIPGDKILYAEDFSQDAIGEMALGWNANGKAEVVTLDKFPGKWMKLYQNTAYLSSNKSTFTKDFTIEFDLVMQLRNTGYTFPLFNFGIFSTTDEPNTDNKFLTHYGKYQYTNLLIRPATTGHSYLQLKSLLKGKTFFDGKDMQYSPLENYYNTKIIHVAMQAQSSRLRVWVNNQKQYDIPQAIPQDHELNQLYFDIGNSGYKEGEAAFYISNIKVATGVPDTRHKLIEEGKFSTTAILFDVNTANLKPESFGIIKDIAQVLKENGDVRINITGHTDSDGSDEANKTLSQKRADAVKEALVKEFSIDEARIETAGKGESQPIGDNKTKEGKAQNRRVEFIKL
jgi:OmpA-OmpF porin, OOP family